MLQAFVHESKSESSPPMFVIGGHIVDGETWAKFSDDWQAELDAEPPLAYAKYIEAMGKRPTGQFYGRNLSDCEVRIAKFRAIIERCGLAAFSLSFRVDHLAETHASLPKKWINPYYSATALLIRQ